jgi:hypothetical protein
VSRRAADAVRRALVRRLNDQLRRYWLGGRVMVTAGVSALGPAFLERALAAVAAFDAFDRENDPFGEHDFGALTVADVRLLFKIDYHDASMSGGSPDPADPSVTTRVLTIMLVHEW